MKPAYHAAFGAFALLLVMTFLTATLVSELLLSQSAIVTVKTGIVYAMALLIVSMAATGGSGFFLGKGRSSPLIARKIGRMRIIAGNGLIVMLPSALFLYYRATSGQFDATFYAVQALELAGSAAQLTLLALNFRDGMKMTEKKRSIARRRATGA